MVYTLIKIDENKCNYLWGDNTTKEVIVQNSDDILVAFHDGKLTFSLVKPGEIFKAQISDRFSFSNVIELSPWKL